MWRPWKNTPSLSRQWQWSHSEETENKLNPCFLSSGSKWSDIPWGTGFIPYFSKDRLIRLLWSEAHFSLFIYLLVCTCAKSHIHLPKKTHTWINTIVKLTLYWANKPKISSHFPGHPAIISSSKITAMELKVTVGNISSRTEIRVLIQFFLYQTSTLQTPEAHKTLLCCSHMQCPLILYVWRISCMSLAEQEK